MMADKRDYTEYLEEQRQEWEEGQAWLDSENAEAVADAEAKAEVKSNPPTHKVH